VGGVRRWPCPGVWGRGWGMAGGGRWALFLPLGFGPMDAFLDPWAFYLALGSETLVGPESVPGQTEWPNLNSSRPEKTKWV